MDHSADFDCAVEGMEWGDVLSTLQVVVSELLGDTPSPPPPSPPPPDPAGLVGFDTHPQPVESLSGGYGGYIPLGAAPHTFEQPSPVMATPAVNAGQAAPIMYQGPLYDQNVTQSGHLYSQTGAYSQGQYQPYQWPVDDIPRAAAASYPAAPPHPAVVGELLGDTPSPPSPSPSPPVPAGLVGFYTHPQPVENLSRGYGGYVPLGAAPHTFEQPSPVMATPGLNAGQAAPIMYQGPLYDQNVTQSGHLYSQTGAYSQGQYLPYQWPVDGIPRAAATSYPAAPPHPYNHVPVVRLPEGMDQNRPAAGVLNVEVVYGIAADVFAPSYSAAPPLNTSLSKKRKRDNQQHEDWLYVKKPPNAFMLFMKEQRPNVVAEFNVSDSALVNTILGQRWKSLSNEEQAKYYEEADKERWLHSQQYPSWSSRDNYGKKRKRNRSKAPTSAEASASKPGEVTQLAKKQCLTSVQTAVMVPSTSQTGVMVPSTSQTAVMMPSTSQTGVVVPSTPETSVMVPSTSQKGVMDPPHTQTFLMQPPHAQTAVTLPVCDICHLPQTYAIYLQDSPTTAASTALVSPAAPTETQTLHH